MHGVAVLLAVSALAQDVGQLERSFAQPPDDARVMMRWWWFGSAVTNAGLEREMRLMKEGGLGGFEVQPVYPIALDEPARGFRNLPFLSAEFLAALRFTGAKARELGLRMDFTLGSGWPYGGPQVAITRAAGRLRVDKVKVTSNRVPLPPLSHGEEFLGAFAGGTERALTDLRDGALWLDAAGRPSEVWFFIAGRTGMMVKRPSVGAEGFVLDHYDRAALDDHLRTVGDPLLQAATPYAIFCDSLEVFGSDWTGDFLAEFQKRRGYDLKPHLPALAGATSPHSAAIRHDWGRTLTELYEEHFLKPLAAYAQAKGTKLRIQGYGIPPMTMSANRHADFPEGEGAQWKVVRAARWASSASHLFDKPVTSSETWTWLHSPSFRATPLDMKAEADIHLLQGVNQFIGHGWPYTPDGEPEPGARFYAAAVFNHKNPWWIAMPDITRYLQRLSHLLRQGQPVADVALYLPVADAWSGFTAGRVHLIEALREHVGESVMPQILDSGFGMDFIDDGALDRLSRYRVLVLPNVERMPLAALRQVEQHVLRGGAVVATRRRPAQVPGFRVTDTEQAEFRAMVERLFARPRVRVVATDSELGAALRSFETPDVILAGDASDIGFVHRRTDSADIYFLANTSNRDITTAAQFRITGRNAEEWDPFTGTVHGVTAGRLHFAPYQSRVIVFTARKLDPKPERKPADPLDLSRGWKLAFPGMAAQPLNGLGSWTEDERTRLFSGVAVYEREVMLEPVPARVELDFGTGTVIPPVERRNGMRAWLDAPVREAAVIEVNGRRAGSVWCAPFALDITPHLKPGRNTIRVSVGNTAINHLAGTRLPDYRLLNLRYGVRFEPQDMNQLEPLPSGLLGPVRLIRYASR